MGISAAWFIILQDGHGKTYWKPDLLPSKISGFSATFAIIHFCGWRWQRCDFSSPEVNAPGNVVPFASGSFA
jgi:hypothetical protein